MTWDAFRGLAAWRRCQPAWVILRHEESGRSRDVGTTWRLSRRWIVGGRADYVESPDPAVTAHEWELHSTLTFWQSEFVYLRAEFTHRRDIAGLDSERLALHAVWAMGPHKHEIF